MLSKKTKGPVLTAPFIIPNPETSFWVEEKLTLFLIGPWGKKQTLEHTIERIMP